MNTFTINIHVKKVWLVVLLAAFAFAPASFGQTVPVTDPTGGFDIDGNLIANNPNVGVGDWVPGDPGAGGYVLDNAGNSVSPNLTGLVRDLYNTGADNVFTGGSKYNDDPNTWIWANSNATGKL